MKTKIEMAIECIEKGRLDEALIHANMALVELNRNEAFGIARAEDWLKEQGLPYTEASKKPCQHHGPPRKKSCNRQPDEPMTSTAGD